MHMHALVLSAYRLCLCLLAMQQTTYNEQQQEEKTVHLNSIIRSHTSSVHFDGHPPPHEQYVRFESMWDVSSRLPEAMRTTLADRLFSSFFFNLKILTIYSIDCLPGFAQSICKLICIQLPMLTMLINLPALCKLYGEYVLQEC